MSALPVVAAYCHPGIVSGDFCRSLAVLSPHIGGRILELRSGPYISRARSFLVERFLELGQPDFLLFVDSDMAFELEDVRRLVDHDLPIVGALYPEQASLGSVNREGIVMGYTIDDPGSRGLLEVDRVPFGLVLIKRAVLESMAEAYADDHPYVFFRVDSEMNGEPPGEDFYFSRRARALGHRCYVDCDTRVGHCKVVPYYPPPVALGA